MERFLVRELNQIKDLVRQFEAYLEQPSSSIESCKDLASRMHLSIEKSIKFASTFSLTEAKVTGSESLPSDSGSPISESFDQAYKCRDGKQLSKKRKAMPKWTSQMTVDTNSSGVAAQLGDGYSWRKYGQKDILGAKHPRGYYRCTHRNTQGCLATKQVQRTDENSMVFDVTYHGTHTCQQTTTKTNSNSLIAKHEQEQGQGQDTKLTKQFQADVKFKIEDGFDSSLLQFPVPSNLVGGFGETNLVSLYDMSEYTDFSELIPMACSGTNSPVPDMDFVIDEFDPNFMMDASSFFS